MIQVALVDMAVVSLTCLLMLIYLYRFVFRYKHEYESNPLCTTAVLFCSTVVFLTTFILPVDIFLVSYIKDTDGSLKDWVTQELLEKIDNGVFAAYFALYGTCVVLIFVVIPFLHFFNEETESNSQDRLHNATMYTLGFTLLAVALITFGILLPLPEVDPNSVIENIIHIATSTKFQKAINLIMAVITVSGILNVSFYTASGIFTWPIGLMIGTASVANSLTTLNDREVILRIRVNALRESARSGNLSPADRSQLNEAENELRQLEMDAIALSGYSESWTYKMRKAIRPTQIIVGTLLVFVSLGLVGSLVISSLDRILHGQGMKQGYILLNPTIFNPLEYLFKQVQNHLEFGPLILLALIFYLVIATISGIRNLGLWFLFARIHRVKLGRTQPQALLFFCITLMLAVLALNNFLYSLAPEFVSFGAQNFKAADGKVTPCSLSNKEISNCILTRSSQLSMRMMSQVWIFGAVLYWFNWAFVVLSILAMLSCIIRGKRTATHGIVNNEDEFED